MIISNEFLENLKKAILQNNSNISLIQECIDNLENLKSLENIENNLQNPISNLKTISENTNSIQQFIYSIIPLLEAYFSKELSKGKTSSENNLEKVELKDNTLIISETKGKVILPYFVSDLECLSKEYNMNYEDIIEQKYTIPISAFKYLSISRFREAFNLARKKEKKSLKYSFDLGMEMLFNYNLHPAIISACRNLDELDIYLDYLDSGETDKFNCFNIVFEIPPIIYKK